LYFRVSFDLDAAYEELQRPSEEDIPMDERG